MIIDTQQQSCAFVGTVMTCKYSDLIFKIQHLVIPGQIPVYN